MKVFDILKSVGKQALVNAVPGAGIVIDTVNALLPEHKRLPSTATGEDVKNAVDSLPPDKQASIYEKELGVEMQEIKSWESIVRYNNKADASGASTRPQIALMFARAYVWSSTLLLSGLLWATYQGEIDISTAWPMALAILCPLMLVIRSYFGYRSEDKQTRYYLSHGVEKKPSGIGSIIEMFTKK